jgi:exodeoxyribonuclease VII small subunit
MKNNPPGRTFEAALAALERIVKQLERGDLPLEESLVLFEQGVRLSRECQDRLNQAERRIEVLLQDEQGRLAVVPFEEAPEPDDSAEVTTEEDGNMF